MNILPFIVDLLKNYLFEVSIILARKVEQIKTHLSGLFRQSRMEYKVRSHPSMLPISLAHEFLSPDISRLELQKGKGIC